MATQGKSGLVPGGFIVYLPWEKVPGLRLGQNLTADTFWTFDHQERELVRAAVIDGLWKVSSVQHNLPLQPNLMSY